MTSLAKRSFTIDGMGANNSTPVQSGGRGGAGTSNAGDRRNMGNDASRTGGNGGGGMNRQTSGPNATNAPVNHFVQRNSLQPPPNAPSTETSPTNNTVPTGTNAPATNRAPDPKKNDKLIQEGQMINMLATIEPSTLTYDAETNVLKFFVTATCPLLTYEIHTGVKEVVKDGIVAYMPNKPKVEPTQIPLAGPLENHSVTLKLDVSRLDDREKKFDKHYSRQMPCVIVLRYHTTEVKKNEESGQKEEVTVEHAEHTAVDLHPKPNRRVISQIVTTGNSSYVVENLYGAEGDNEVTLGSTVAQNADGGSGGVENEEDLLCVICLTNMKDTSVMPCRHMCLCKECGEQLLQSRPLCPVCRAPIVTLLHKPK